MLTLTILSTTLFFGFIIFNTFKFSILTSYSAYGTVWGKLSKNINIWSAITVLSAFLLTPPLIEAGVENPFQFLGFFMPVYLIAVGLTPEWETDKKQAFWHSFFAFLCAISAIIWLILFKACYFQIIFIFVLCTISAIWTKTWKECYVFWLEMLIFLVAFGANFL